VALGDGIRRNIASVDPAVLRDALIELNRRVFPGSRSDAVPGGVTWWFKQDEIHQATHVHGGPEFLPWHREIVNRLEALLRQINPQLSLHYWDWTQDPRAIANANLGAGATGTLNLFTSDFMGYGGSSSAPIGEPWLSAGYYVPGALPHRDGPGGNAADPPRLVNRFVAGSPAGVASDRAIVAAGNYRTMRDLLESVHDAMHGFVNMGGQHISFRDPFVFLLHSNVDRLFALWQTQPGIPQRLDPNLVYGPESDDPGLNSNVEPWSTGHSLDQFGVEHFTRPWFAPENEGVPKTYKDPSIVAPPLYDTSGGDLGPRWHPFHTTGDRLRNLVVGQNADGRLEVFGTAGDDTIWHTWQTSPSDGWSSWEPFHTVGDRLRNLVVGQNADGRLEVFGTAGDDTIWHTWQTSPSDGWTA
jgi:hypothetical protein